MRRLSGASELLDGPLDAAMLAGNLRDLEQINRLLGGVSVSWRAVEPLLKERPDGAVRLLDVGTGSGDIPRALRRRTDYRRTPLDVVATDVRPEIVEAARRTADRAPWFEVKLAPQDQIPEQDGSFDIVHSSLLMHHLEPDAAAAMLAEMSRVASRAVIVNDLDRSRTWLAGARVLSRLLTRNPYTRHDAPLSVMRAYRPDELVALATRAGLVEEARHWARPSYRYAITFRHGATSPDD